MSTRPPSPDHRRIRLAIVTEILSQLSTVFIYAAMGLYAAAFIAFALDLARRGARVTAVEAASVPSAVQRRSTVPAPVGARTTIGAAAGEGATTAPPTSRPSRLPER